MVCPPRTTNEANWCLQKHDQASTGPQAIAPWCGRAPRVDSGKLHWQCICFAKAQSSIHRALYKLRFTNDELAAAANPTGCIMVKGASIASVVPLRLNETGTTLTHRGGF